MFEPIRARLASSFSRNGISAAATETICLGDTSIRSTSSLRRQAVVAGVAGNDQIVGELALVVELGVGLGDVVLGLFHGRQIDHVVGDLAVHDLAVRRLDEAVLVDAGEGRERVDQADVRAFRRLDRADAAIVGRMHVADFEAGTLTGQTARPERRETTLVRDLGERVGLVHELAELATSRRTRARRQPPAWR